MNMQSPSWFGSGFVQMSVAFDRREMPQILSVYGRMVAAGEWRDHGISNLCDMAVFSFIRCTDEQPIYRGEKQLRLRLRQGMYLVIGMDGRILKQGHDLRTVLRVLERRLIRAVDRLRTSTLEPFVCRYRSITFRVNAGDGLIHGLQRDGHVIGVGMQQ